MMAYCFTAIRSPKATASSSALRRLFHSFHGMRDASRVPCRRVSCNRVSGNKDRRREQQQHERLSPAARENKKHAGSKQQKRSRQFWNGPAASAYPPRGYPMAAAASTSASAAA